MKTKASNHIIKLRVNPIFGDLGMVVQFIKSGIVRNLWRGESKAFWSSFLWLLKAKIELVAMLSRSIFRYNHGRHTTGVFMSIWAITMVMAFNQGDAFGYVLSFVPFGTPLLLINVSWLQFQDIVWYEASSQFVSIWLGIFTVLQVIHVVRIYLEIGNTDDHMKRGTSWLYSGILKTKYLSEIKIQCLVEPVLTVLFGYVVWCFTGDIIFVVLTSASAICLFLQEFSDVAYRYYHSRF